jgi:drug/metabolite transporter (DMT)-like permease
MTQAVVLVFIAVCFSVTGELLLKAGMTQVGVLSLHNLTAMIPRMLRTPFLWLGLGSIGIGAGFWLVVISRVDLSWAYPMLAMGYILALIFAGLVLREHVPLIRWIGAVVIVVGVYLITRS